MSNTLSDKFVRLLRVSEGAQMAIDRLPNDGDHKAMLDMALGEVMNAAHAALGSAISVSNCLQRIAETHMEDSSRG